MGIRLYGAYDDKGTQGNIDQVNIVNNTISSTENTKAFRKLGVGVYKVNASKNYNTEQAITIAGNTIDLTKGTSSGGNDSLLYIGSNVNATLNLSISNNVFAANDTAHVIYVAEIASNKNDKVTLKGSIYNNNFVTAKSGFVRANDGAVVSSSLSWNTTPVTGKNIVDGTTIADDWWGTWSSDRKATDGYLTFAEAGAAIAAELPVADLAPLVTVGTPTGTLKIEGDLSIENGTTSSKSLTAKLSDGTVAAVGPTWTVADAAIITLTPTTSSTVTYKPLRVGTATVKVNTTVNVLITSKSRSSSPSIRSRNRTLTQKSPKKMMEQQKSKSPRVDHPPSRHPIRRPPSRIQQVPNSS